MHLFSMKTNYYINLGLAIVNTYMLLLNIEGTKLLFGFLAVFSLANAVLCNYLRFKFDEQEEAEKKKVKVKDLRPKD